MKRTICISLGLWVILAISTCAFAYMKQGEEEVLRGLKAVHVKVERLKAEIEQDGLFASTLESDLEMKLRMAGIKVLSDEQYLQNPDSPYVYLFVDAFKHSEGYVYRIQICLREPVLIIRTRMKAIATTLRIRDELGITANLSEIRDEAQTLWMNSSRPGRTPTGKKRKKGKDLNRCLFCVISLALRASC